ncbi:pyridoxal 5'-phosphate synthase glutaminase subunit PdxT [bacterium]|nr:pyridoxal 5'-phosphate synthase glutaminase subunit PdxT [bacterium]MBU1637854.1 pyridoxal 5'-phosphate synthase glutaminase subunit PdxT [bacterium]
MVKANIPPVAGLLALQGDFEKHKAALRALGAEVIEVRTEDQLEHVDALIIPGGESTTMTILMPDSLRSSLIQFASSHPVWGTCAGMIMLSTTRSDSRVRPLGLVDLEVERMGFGRQVFSFEGELRLSERLAEHERPFKGFFIRAPRVKEKSKELEVLAWLNDEPVALIKGNILLTSFHPELAEDDRFHRFFLSMIDKSSSRKG